MITERRIVLFDEKGSTLESFGLSEIERIEISFANKNSVEIIPTKYRQNWTLRRRNNCPLFTKILIKKVTFFIHTGLTTKVKDYEKDGFFTTVPFDKDEFFKLIDFDGVLDNETKQSFWDEYAMYNSKDLNSFYNMLDELSPTSQYVKKSITLYFYVEAFGGSTREALVRYKKEPGLLQAL